ncbi:MAG: hypothetical protein JWP06_671 [Candidatus Saccharibacteria bacterium]|nr:hypothetical protein [Candidatus Saccharibacteria bacterium]
MLTRGSESCQTRKLLMSYLDVSKLYERTFSLAKIIEKTIGEL